MPRLSEDDTGTTDSLLCSSGDDEITLEPLRIDVVAAAPAISNHTSVPHLTASCSRGTKQVCLFMKLDGQGARENGVVSGGGTCNESQRFHDDIVMFLPLLHSYCTELACSD